MICSNCQQWNPASATQCLRCQTPLTSPQVPPQPTAAVTFGFAAPPPSVDPMDIPQETGPFKPSGRIAPLGIPLLALATLLGSVLMGNVYFQLIHNFPSLEFGKLGILLAFAIGAGLGGLFVVAVRIGRVRNPIVACACAVIAMFLTFGARIVVQANQPGVRIAMAMDKAMAMAERGQPVQDVFTAKPSGNPLTTVTDYLEWMSQGHVVRKSYGGTPAKPVTGFDFWFEYLYPCIGLILAPVIAYGTARRRYCEACSLWYSEFRYCQGPMGVTDAVVARIRAGDWSGARLQCGGKNSDPQSSCVVTVYRCLTCKESRVAVSRINRGRSATVYEAAISPDCGERLKTGQKGPAIPTAAG